MDARGAMVLRSVYLPTEMDETLRILAFQQRVTKAELIRQFVDAGLAQLQGKSQPTPILQGNSLSDFEIAKSNQAVLKMARLADEQVAMEQQVMAG